MKKYLFLLLIILISLSGVKAASVQEYYFNVKPNLKLRVVKVKSFGGDSQRPKKVIIFLPGQASFYEKNQDFVELLAGHRDYMTQEQQPPAQNPFRDLNADVWVIDYRAHGKSEGRLGMNDQRCHIGDFQDYLNDLHQVVTQHIMPFYQQGSASFYLMGSSLGGHLALRYVQDFSHHFAKVFLIVPMLDFKTKPWPKWMARTIVNGACLLGLEQKYAVGYGDLDLANQTFKREKSHHNLQAFEDTLALLRAHPHLITSGPTNGWVAAAFMSCDKLMTPEALRRVSVPVMIFAAGEDHKVENPAMQEAQKFLQSCTMITLDGAWHNLLKESDQYRVGFLQQLAHGFNP